MHHRSPSFTTPTPFLAAHTKLFYHPTKASRVCLSVVAALLIIIFNSFLCPFCITIEPIKFGELTT